MPNIYQLIETGNLVCLSIGCWYTDNISNTDYYYAFYSNAHYGNYKIQKEGPDRSLVFILKNRKNYKNYKFGGLLSIYDMDLL